MSATQGNPNTFNQGAQNSGKGSKAASSFVQANTSNSNNVAAAAASNPTMGGSAQKPSVEKNFQVRKSYIQTNSRNANLTGRGANTRVSVGSA